MFNFRNKFTGIFRLLTFQRGGWDGISKFNFLNLFSHGDWFTHLKHLVTIFGTGY